MKWQVDRRRLGSYCGPVLHGILNAKAGLQRFRGPRQEKVTLDEILKNLERNYEVHGRRSLPQLRSHLKHVRRFFVFDRALAITTPRLQDYIAHRQKEGAAAATINRELEAIQRAFGLAVESDVLSLAPRVPSLPEHNARQGFFERADFDRVLAGLGDSDLRDFCEWFWWTGMRPGEICALAWDALDRETWTLRLHAKDAKTGHGRAIALTGPWRDVIERRLKARRLDCELIFHRKGGQSATFESGGVARVGLPGSKGVSSMISAAPPFAIWCAPGSIPRS